MEREEIKEEGIGREYPHDDRRMEGEEIKVEGQIGRNGERIPTR